MSYNGSGTFNLYSPGNPVVTGTSISSTWANNTLSDIATGLSTAITKDGQTTPTANLPMGGFKFTGLAAGSANGDSVRYEQSPAGIMTTTGDIIYASAANTPARLAAGTSGYVLTSGGAGVAPSWAVIPTQVPRSYLAGLTMSTAGSSATMSIAAGSCADSTNVNLMNLSAIAKTTSSWAVGTGNGGLDTGVIANSTWYHFYVIKRTDTGVTDVVFSTSASSPTLPTNYTLYRRIGSGFTDGSAQWTKFSQDGDTFLWDTMALNINTAAASATATNYAMSTPLGIKTTALLHGTFTFVGSAGKGCLLSSPDEADIAPVVNTGKVTYANPVDSQYVSGDAQVRTNTSSEIRVRCTDNNSNLNVNTYGWIDTRGRDS